ncbi:MAG: DMT family transporter [Syntrophomonadaceae bacterium]|nr:DMT family transporter [Syntrophomonadaceae bacterium]
MFKSNKKALGVALVVLSALGFGSVGILVKLAYNHGVNTLTMLAGRFTLAALAIWVIIWLSRLPCWIKPSHWKPFVITCLFGYGLGSTCFFLAVKLIPVSLAIMILYTYPTMVALVETLMHKQKITRPRLLALLLSTIGLGLILGATLEGINFQGAALGLCAATFYTAYLVYGNQISRNHHPLLTTGYIASFAAIGYSVLALITGSFSLGFDPVGWASIIGLALLGTALGILTLFTGMRWLRPGEVAIISTIEPVFTVVCAALLFAEPVMPLQLVGGLMVLAAIITIQLNPQPV